MGLLTLSPAAALQAQSSLCDVGSSAVELVHLHSTGGSTRVDAPLVGSSLVFVAECPGRVVRTFDQVAKAGFDPQLRQHWIEAVRTAARNPSNATVRGLLAVARGRVAARGDRSLDRFLDGIFDGSARGAVIDRRTRDLLISRQAAATLEQYSHCDAAGCFATSDVLLFLLGTHPVPLLRAMHADSATTVRWLNRVANESFSGVPERRRAREAARNAVLRKLSETKAPGLERERRACRDRLRTIRYSQID